MSRIKKKIEEFHFTKENKSIVLNVLKPISYLYNRITRIRRGIYEKNILKSRQMGCFTITVGNLTYGGTGKTPVVINLAERLSNKGLRVGIIHSGYGSPQHKSKSPRRILNSNEGPDVGDEAAELFVRAKDALVYSSRDRVEAIERAIFEGGVNVCILDDAFQYLKIMSDLKIVVVDFYDRFGNEQCLPAGPMRESKDALKYADIVWFVSHKEYEKTEDLEEGFLRINKSLKFVYSKFVIDSLIRLRDMQTVDISTIRGNVISFCGIGRGNRFVEMLHSAGIRPVSHLSFGDHHRYTSSDIRKINNLINQYRTNFVITTEKDYLRDTKALSKIENLYILRVNLELISGDAVLNSIYDSLL
jgi:tetraacyldisaccharide 4'-kinase